MILDSGLNAISLLHITTVYNRIEGFGGEFALPFCLH